MKICDFMKTLYDDTENTPEFYAQSCDGLKMGDPGAELRKIAVSMFATHDVMQAAADWGANLLIVHEPCFYRHMDELADFEKEPEWKKKVVRSKLEFARECGLTVYRFHDHPHHRNPDMISEGEVKYWGLQGKWNKGPFYAVNEFELASPMPVKELAAALEKNLNVAHIRICGSKETVCRKLGLCFGTPGHVEDELETCDAVLTGEICEWGTGEYVRDLSTFCGEKKSILVLGHIPSERDGMRLLADVLHEKYPSWEAKYFESGEVYTYCEKI